MSGVCFNPPEPQSIMKPKKITQMINISHRNSNKYVCSVCSCAVLVKIKRRNLKMQMFQNNDGCYFVRKNY